ncbi:MAG: hypothetical protein ACI4RJ_03930 [Alphaproteobacteria bacterium]
MTQNVINLGTFTAPYREFSIKIPAGQMDTLRYDHQIIEIIENNLPDDIEACFGGVGGFTNLETGIAYRYPDNNIIPYVQFRNKNKSEDANLRVAVAVGDIVDNRLVLSGTISVQSAQTSPLYTYPEVYTDAVNIKNTIPAEGSVNVQTYMNGYKKVIIQNTGENNMFLFEQDGFILPPQATFVHEVPTQSIRIFGTVGDTFYCRGYK